MQFEIDQYVLLFACSLKIRKISDYLRWSLRTLKLYLGTSLMNYGLRFTVLKHSMLYKYDKTDFLSVFPANVYDKVL